MKTPHMDEFRSLIIGLFPELAASTFRLATKGWDSTAVDVDDRLIFKFPRHGVAKRALLREAALLAVIRPSISTAVPDMRIHEGPPLFSVHAKVKGEHLLTADYAKLSQDARQRLGEDLARFYAEIHQLDADRIRAAGARAIGPWQAPDVVRAKALPVLPREIRDRAKEIVLEFERLPPDPYGTIYGFFDGHGWNMAFDHSKGLLIGIYDFADSGFGPLHQDFIYSNFISPDLTERIVTAYEQLTGLKIDRRRIEILTGFHRLSELAELTDDPEHAPTMIRSVAAWAGMTDHP
ncbi:MULTISPECIES: aminoglycoside phosphotransferase family protein [unclassified Sinorhizobium]|uniref:aminoglycoside phosphotransferase family protein n=1 Tax=unclassified Sinorhizobium TaxID=2613772 RepID=UPI003525CAC9